MVRPYGGLYWGARCMVRPSTVDCTGGLDVWSDHLRWTVLGGARCMARPSTVDCTGGG